MLHALLRISSPCHLVRVGSRLGPRLSTAAGSGAPLPAYDALKDVSRGCKFGERRHRAVPSAFVVVCCSDLFARHLHGQLADLELGLPRRLVFLRHEATVAGHSKSAVDALSVPGAEQDLRGTIEERQRTVPRIPRMTGFISTVASKGTISIDGWIRMGLLSVPLR